jgi:hypothetical protein
MILVKKMKQFSQPRKNIWGFYRAQRAFFTVLFACHSSREVELCGPHTNEN